MNEKELINAGTDVMKRWEEKVHALILEYRKLEQEAKEIGEEIDSKKLMETAKKRVIS